MSTTPRDPFRAGAARAAGERRRRRATPLVGADPVVAVPGVKTDPVEQPGSAPTASAPPASSLPSASSASAASSTRPAVGTPRAHRPVPRVTPAPSPAHPRTVDVRPGADKARVRRLRAVPDPDTTVDASPPSDLPAPDSRQEAEVKAGPRSEAPRPAYRERVARTPSGDEITDSLLAAALTQQELTPDIEDVLGAVIGVLRTLAAASGLGADEVEGQVARTLAFLRRRLTGEYAVDEFGFDQDYTDNFYLPLLRPLYKQWFRVEVRGIENLPADGSALIVANHSGTIALDAHMVQLAVHDEHPDKRHLRLLGADLVFQAPLIGPLARKQGATLAANADAERLLRNGQIVGVFPEGFKGVGKPFSERYKLQRFGRGGFVSAAIRTGAPIVPCSIVGAEETYPLIGNVKLLARLFGAPYFPVTPTWPWLGLLGLIPLPSKWIIEFGAPVPTHHLGPAAADDPMLVFDLTDQVRETIQQTLYSLLMLRRSVFS